MPALRVVIWHDPYMRSLSQDQIDQLTLSQDQVAQIPKWLKGHQFKLIEPKAKRFEKWSWVRVKSQEKGSGERTWARDRCKVRIRKEGDHNVVAIYAGDESW